MGMKSEDGGLQEHYHLNEIFQFYSDLSDLSFHILTD
jgi:hypothetical protein